MKFRYKVLLINMILLSVGIGTVGFFMIDKNFKLALDTQIKNAIEENNLLQSTAEYQLLDYINQSPSRFELSLPQVGNTVSTGMSANQSTMFIVYDGTLFYSNHEAEASYPDILWQQAEIGKKSYLITRENGVHYIYVTSCNTVMDKNLNIINKRNIEDAYTLMEQQSGYFRFLLIIVVSLCSVFMYFISFLLTHPLEALSKTSERFGKGDYSVRASVKTHDEIGMLADTYNQMADSVSQHVNELQDMIARQEQFIADFTHEIKTPMTTIIGYADMLRSKEMNRKQQIMSASYIFSEGKRLESMSMKLFEFIYTKKHEIIFLPFYTEKLAKTIAASVTPMLEKKEITLRMNVTNCILKGDMELLSSAFINLIDNARKASEQHSEILFTGTVLHDGFLFTVQDFGIGISKEHLSKICDEFYMVDKSRSRKEGGAGLGLSLSALIFQSHNTDFRIESTPGKGTTISVLFREYEKIKKENAHEE